MISEVLISREAYFLYFRYFVHLIIVACITLVTLYFVTIHGE